MTPRKQKPHGHSVLNRLTPERQRAVQDYALNHTLAETIKWLADDGVKIGDTALSNWLSYLRLAQRMERCSGKADAIVEQGRAEGWIETAEEEQAIGQCLFNRMAMDEEDPKAWFLSQTIVLKRQKMEIEKKALAIAQQNADLALTKYKDEVDQRKQAIQREMASAKNSGGISPETLAKIESELKLL
jgi:hypothetical protein